MLKKKYTFAISLLISALLVGCGSTSSSKKDDNISEPILSLDKKIEVEEGYVSINGKKRALTFISKQSNSSRLFAFNEESEFPIIEMSTENNIVPDFARMLVTTGDNNGTFNCLSIKTEQIASTKISTDKVYMVKAQLCRGYGENIGKRQDIEFMFPYSIFRQGATRLKIEGDSASLDSIYSIGKSSLKTSLGERTFNQIFDVTKNHPEVKTIVLGKVTLEPLSTDLLIRTGKLIREAGVNTKLTNESLIHGAGVGLFVAGVERSMESNATISVSSWKTNSGEYGADIDIDDPIHKSQIDYYSEMLGDGEGQEFYRFSLNKNITTLSKEKITEYGLLTK